MFIPQGHIVTHRYTLQPLSASKGDTGASTGFVPASTRTRDVLPIEGTRDKA